jgi:hypothetical protein
MSARSTSVVIPKAWELHCAANVLMDATPPRIVLLQMACCVSLYTKKVNQRSRDLHQWSCWIAILIGSSQDHLDPIVGTTTKGWVIASMARDGPPRCLHAANGQLPEHALVVGKSWPFPGETFRWNGDPGQLMNWHRRHELVQQADDTRQEPLDKQTGM